MFNKIKLQILLSHSGVCSRRKALEIIREGKVTVNGRINREPSTKINPQEDKVCVNGKEVEGKSFEYIIINKPSGIVTTKTDKFADKTVLDILPKKFKHLSPAGRLDKNTEGLLLLTNDGQVAYKLTHPKFNIDKIYQVKIQGRLRPQDKSRLEKGIIIEGKRTAPAKIKNVKLYSRQTEFFLSIHEGRKRQIRIMIEKIRHRVIYLKRISQGPLMIGHLRSGQWRFLSKLEIKNLKAL